MDNNFFGNDNEAPATEVLTPQDPVEQAIAEETPAEEAVFAEAPAANKEPNKFLIMLKKHYLKFIIGAVAAFMAFVVAVSGIAVAISFISNSSTRPVKVTFKYLNKKSYYDQIETIIDLSNGFCKSELKTIYKLGKSTEDYKDDHEDRKENFEDYIDDAKDEYGNNYKFKYEINDKDEIERDDIRSFRDTLRNAADRIEEEVEDTEDYDSDDWEDLADKLGFDGNKSKAKKYVKAMKSIGKKLQKAKITAGYEIEYTQILTGSELDEPREYDTTMYVYKIDGKWVDRATVQYIISLSYVSF